MKTTIKMPKLADSTDEVAVLDVLAAAGDTIAVGDDLFEVETDKTTVVVPAPVSGVVVEVLASVDDEVTTGTPVMVVETGAGS